MSRRNSAPASPVSRPRRRRGLPWGKMFLLGLIGLIAAAWFAPAIVMKTPLRDRLLSIAAKDFPGKLAIGSASAGWLSSIELRNASAFDQQGQEVLRVERIASEKNLFSLLLDPNDIGKVRIEKPQLKLELRPDGSNVEDLIKPFLEGEPSAAPIGFGVEVVDGVVEVSQVGGDPFRLDQLNANFKLPHDRASVTAQVKTSIATANSPPGNLTADMQWQSASKEVPGQGVFHIQSAGMPLQLAGVALRRAGANHQISGLLSADAELTVTDKNQIAKVKQLDVQNLVFESPEILGTDRLQLASLVGSGEVAHSGLEWQVRQLNLKSDVGDLNISGSGPAGTSPSPATELTSAIRRGNWEIRSGVDLAKLAAILPATLRLREGTHVSSGRISADLVSQSQGGNSSWNARIQATGLAAIHSGAAHQWKQPILLTAAVKESPAGIAVENLTCDSAFLKLSGKGTLEQGALTLAGDLSQFVSEVGRFVDLGTVRAAGNVTSQIDWKSGADQKLSLTGKAAAQNFELTYVADRPWKEDQLDVQFSADGKLNAGTLDSIEAATVEVNAAGDRLNARLLEPVRGVSSNSVWPCDVDVRGDLGQWLARLQMFFTLDPWQFGGDNFVLTGQMRVSPQLIELTNASGKVSNFIAARPGMMVRESAIEIQTSASYDVERGEFVTPATIITSSTVALRAQKMRIQSAGGQVAVDGDVQYRTNLERLANWVRDSRSPATYRVRGEATGQVHLVHQQGATKVDGTMSVKELRYERPVQSTGLTIVPVNQANPWQETWYEPQLEMTVEGTLDSSGQAVTLDKLQVAGDTLSVGAAGTITDLTGRCHLDLAGLYAYDLDRLAGRLRNTIGSQIQMAGSGQRAFKVQGPVFSVASSAASPRIRPTSTSPTPATTEFGLAEMLAETSIGWQTLNIQGIEIGQGEITTKLDRGQLAISPISLPVSEGKIAITPTVDMTKTPYVATIQPGTVVDQVRITPQMCRSWLKYLAPLMADATAAEGHFSVSIKDAQFPVSDPTGGNIEGQFVVHAAQIGPGPLSQEILALVQQIRDLMERKVPGTTAPAQTAQWIDLPEQRLNFQLADHKVYHKDMQMFVKDVAIRTSGWVGLDQQIALVAEVPVLDAWVAQDRYLASLKGQVIRLPISGSLKQPRVDRTALQQFTRQAAVEAGSNLLQQELNKGLERGLNRLFQPKTPAPQPGTAPQP